MWSEHVLENHSSATVKIKWACWGFEEIKAGRSLRRWFLVDSNWERRKEMNENIHRATSVA